MLVQPEPVARAASALVTKALSSAGTAAEESNAANPVQDAFITALQESFAAARNRQRLRCA